MLASLVVVLMVATSFAVMGHVLQRDRADLLSEVPLQWQKNVNAAIESGELPSDASSTMVKDWLANRMLTVSDRVKNSYVNPLNSKAVAEAEAASGSGSEPPVVGGTGKILVILLEFSGSDTDKGVTYTGPMHNTIPQPSTFWHRKVYETCGDFDERHNQGLDYLQWCTGLPSRVDTAPTIHAGRAYIGCHDGRVYALSLADGRLAWRFTAAPSERRIISGDRVESAWPVFGAVLVHDGLVHAVAGHHTAVEDGLLFWGLDPATGAVKYRQTFTGIKGPQAVILPTHWYKHEEVALNNVLLGGKVGDTSIIRLYDEWGGWDFRSKDGTLFRQHQADIRKYAMHGMAFLGL